MPTYQYYYKNEAGVCWHDEGTGPLPTATAAKPLDQLLGLCTFGSNLFLTWREKPVESENTEGERLDCSETVRVSDADTSP